MKPHFKYQWTDYGFVIVERPFEGDMSKDDFLTKNVRDESQPLNKNCKCSVRDLPRGSLVIIAGAERLGIQVYCGESIYSTETRHMVKMVPMDEDASEGLYATHQHCATIYVPYGPPWPFSKAWEDNQKKEEEKAKAKKEAETQWEASWWQKPMEEWTEEELQKWQELTGESM